MSGAAWQWQSGTKGAILRLAYSRSVFRRSAWRGMAFALALYLLAVAARELFGIAPGQYPFLTFFPAVVLTAIFAGARPAILLSAASLLTAWYFYIPPFRSFGLSPALIPALFLFVFIVSVIVYFVHALTSLTEKLEAEQRVSSELIEQQRTMFAELQHRVANNLSFLSSLLVLQKKQIAAEPEAAPKLLDETVRRLDTMGRLHRRLHDPGAVNRPMPEYLQELCADLLAVSGARNIVCLVDADDVRLDLARLTAMSLLIAELVTNSLKHAFTGRDGGTIRIDLKRKEGEEVSLEVSDDGPGMPAGSGGRAAPGLGIKIIQGLATQMNAKISLPEAGSSLISLAFPSGRETRR